MTTDLFGNPLSATAEYRLSLWQKRQAAMLYRWMSLDYLKGLKTLIDKLIQGADVSLDLAERQGRDALITNRRWGVRDTAANWSTYVYPALEDFRRSTIRLIAWRASENYCGTGASHCSRMLSEFSSLWMTPGEEERFGKQFDAVYSYASKIDHVAGAGGGKYLKDSSMVAAWDEDESQFFPRLPRFRVRTDVEGETGKRPQRSGVYVPQDDPNGTLQFGWAGNDDGKLGKVQTFNDAGLRALAAIGRRDLWRDEQKMIDHVKRELAQGLLQPESGIGEKDLDEMSAAWIVLSPQAVTSRPCKWYFVEMIDGEFDDADEDEAAEMLERTRPNVPANQPCPEAGWWFTPAKPGSRRYFKQGETMPAVGGDYGETFWQWSPDQSAPAL